jgi:excisionase family DNA binding protein
MAKRHDRRRVKIHINYDITEVADLLGVHKHTVRRWIAAGLPTTDDKRPLLIHGAELLAFLKTREPAKQRCKPGEFFCLGCKSPKRAAGDMAGLCAALRPSRLALWVLPDMWNRDVSRGECQRDWPIERRSGYHLSKGETTIRRYLLSSLKC